MPVDGQAVALQNNGRSDFHALLTRARRSASLARGVRLRAEWDDQRLRPIEARRELMRLVSSVDGILFGGALAADGATVFEGVRTAFKGIVSKR